MKQRPKRIKKNAIRFDSLVHTSSSIRFDSIRQRSEKKIRFGSLLIYIQFDSIRFDVSMIFYGSTRFGSTESNRIESNYRENYMGKLHFVSLLHFELPVEKKTRMFVIRVWGCSLRVRRNVVHPNYRIFDSISVSVMKIKLFSRNVRRFESLRYWSIDYSYFQINRSFLLYSLRILFNINCEFSFLDIESNSFV